MTKSSGFSADFPARDSLFFMKSTSKNLFILFGPLLGSAVLYAAPVKSPDGRLAVDVRLTAEGTPIYDLKRDEQPLLGESKLGLVREDVDFTKGLKLSGESPETVVEDRYELLIGKRRLNTYRANRKVYELATADGKKVDVVFQVSNDGVGFRYVFSRGVLRGAENQVRGNVVQISRRIQGVAPIDVGCQDVLGQGQSGLRGISPTGDPGGHALHAR